MPVAMLLEVYQFVLFQQWIFFKPDIFNARLPTYSVGRKRYIKFIFNIYYSKTKYRCGTENYVIYCNGNEMSGIAWF